MFTGYAGRFSSPRHHDPVESPPGRDAWAKLRRSGLGIAGCRRYELSVQQWVQGSLGLVLLCELTGFVPP